MPSKKKKYNARFPAGRIKKIMQTDEEVGKVAQAVPVIISRTLELFVESLLSKSMQITQSRNAKTLTPSHMKQCILSENRFDFLKDLVKDVPDASAQEDNENNAIFEANLDRSEDTDSIDPEFDNKLATQPDIIDIDGDDNVSPAKQKREDVPKNYYNEQSTSSRTPVIQYAPNVAHAESTRINFSVNRLLRKDRNHIPAAPPEGIPVPQLVQSSRSTSSVVPPLPKLSSSCDNVPPLIPISHNLYGQTTSDNLCIDEDYDN